MLVAWFDVYFLEESEHVALKSAAKVFLEINNKGSLAGKKPLKT